MPTLNTLHPKNYTQPHPPLDISPMRITLLLILSLLLLTTPLRADDFDQYIKQSTSTKYLLILASSPNYPALERQAKSLARKSHIPYDAQGQIFAPTRGLILPDNDPDPIWAGHYLLRRDNLSNKYPNAPTYLSIEKSDAYPTLKPHLYILIAKICNTRTEARHLLPALKKFAPTAYTHRTTIYMGCMH